MRFLLFKTILINRLRRHEAYRCVEKNPVLLPHAKLFLSNSGNPASLMVVRNLKIL